MTDLFVVLGLWFFALGASAQTASVRIEISSGTPILATPLELQATVPNPPKASSVLDLAASTTDSFAIAKVQEDPQKTSGAALRTFRVQILPLAEGRVPINLFWKTRTPSGLFESSGSIILNVAARSLKNPAINDIKSPLGARPALWPYILAAALIALLVWGRRRFRKAEVGGAAPVILDTRPPGIIAREQIERLKASGLWESGRRREFYFELSEILKRYFERRFDMPATKMTSFELYRQLKYAELDGTVLARFKSLFERADLVKFAKTAPEQDWGNLDIESANRLIDLTEPKAPELSGTSQETVK